MEKKQLEVTNYAELEAKSRFASLFPQDIKFLQYLVQYFEPKFDDTDPISGYSHYKLMHERVRLKLEAYLELFAGKDPEVFDPNIVYNAMPPDFKNKYYDQILAASKEYIEGRVPLRD